MMVTLYSLVLLSSLALLALAAPGFIEPTPELDVNVTVTLVVASDIKTGPFAEDCVKYCTLSYPPHTYPQPLHFQACRTGCRTAQLDAFIAWPGHPEPKLCTQGCHDVYSVEGEEYACNAGCMTPTLDSTFPERSHLYDGFVSNSNVSQGEQEIDSFISQMWAAVMYPIEFFEPQEFDDLQEHAIDMEMVIIPYRRFDITILTDDDVYDVQHYIIGGDPMVSGGDQIPSSINSDALLLTYSERRHGCVWFRHRMVFTNILMFLSVSLTLLGLVMCCSSMFSKDKKTEKLKPTVSQTLEPFPSTKKKAPYELGFEFLQMTPFDTHNHGKATMI